MKNITQVQRIVKEFLPTSLKDSTTKAGWLNNILFKDIGFDPHAAAIKCGSSFESIFHDIAKIRYPGQKLPRAITGHGVTDDEVANYYSLKFENNQSINKTNAIPILTRLKQDTLAGFVATRLEQFRQDRKKKKSSRLDLGYFLDLSNDALAEVPLQNEISHLCVDLCLVENHSTLVEIKATFDTDDGKTQHELAKMLMAFIALGYKSKRLFFGVITNNKGYKKNGEWRGRLGSFVSKDLILVENDLWNLLAPQDVSFDEFKQIVETQYSLNLNKCKKAG